MRTEIVTNEVRLAVARRNSVLDSVSVNGNSGVYGKDVSSDTNDTGSLVSSESNTVEDSHKYFAKQLKHSLIYLRLVQILMYAAIILFLTLVIELLAGCKSEVKTVTDLDKYNNELTECREKGKDAGTYSVYESCAKEVDTKYGKKND